MKLECWMCGEMLEVGEKCNEVICDCCLIAGAPLYSKNGIDYYTEEAFADLLGESKTDEKEIWEGAQEMRDEGLSLRGIAKRLHTSKSTIGSHTVGKNKAVPSKV